MNSETLSKIISEINSLPKFPKTIAFEFNPPNPNAPVFINTVRSELERIVPEQKPRLIVLHDSRCCFGTIAASKGSADIIFHCGPTCCSKCDCVCPVVTIPSGSVVLEDVVSRVKTSIQEFEENGVEGNIVVAVDAGCAGFVDSIMKINDKISDVVVQEMPTEKSLDKSSDDYVCFAGWRFSKKSLFEDDKTTAKAALLYVGESGEAVRAMAYSVPCVDFKYVCFGDEESALQVLGRNRVQLVMRRSRAIEDVKNSESFGILVANPSHVEGARKLIEIMERVSSEDGTERKAFVICMDNINEYKLANFPDVHISCFVVAACPYKMDFLDSRRYDRPVVSASEFIFGLTDDMDWVNKYTTDYSTLI